MAVTNAGTLIAAYDARPSMNDLPSHIAIVVRRSGDGGRSWGTRQMVRADTAPFGFGDPSLLVDRTTGRIFLFYAASARQGFIGSKNGSDEADPDILQADLSWSDDDGVTWQHRRITREIKDPAWGGLFAASGAGVQLRHGPHTGRLIQQYVVRYQGGNDGASAYSDDQGDSWQMGSLVGPGVDENKSVELSDGSVMLNSRARPSRLIALSHDGGVTYSGLHSDTTLPDPGNNGAILRWYPDALSEDPRSHWLLFSNAADTTDRRNLVLRLSCNDGERWSRGVTIAAGEAAYSTLAVLPDGSIGVLFERGGYRYITFARVPAASVGRCP